MDKTVDTSENIVTLPGVKLELEPKIPTPKSDKIIENAKKLKKLSKYPCDFDFETYRKLELRFGHEQPRGGITFNTPLKLVNSHSTCQQCLYAFEIDTYGRGCTHDCVYCYAKAELTAHGYWNRPFPMPVDISQIWKIFYTVFETDKKSKWRDVLEKRVPVRIGSMSDSFMYMDKKYKVTQELLKLLNYYNYPYIIFTRSDLVAHDDYLELLNPDLCSVQMSIASTNDELNRMIEPGTPNAKKRLKALQKLVRNGFWTTVRINPFFPIYPDGYFTDPNFDKDSMPKPFNFSSFEMVDEITSYGVQSILAGMVRLSGFSLNQIEKATGRNLRKFYREDNKKNSRDFHYSDKEIRAYYERIHAKCIQNGVQFTTCYIGNGENHFWKDQDLWSNKKDCCNAISRVKAFKNPKTSRDIPWQTRMKHTSHKCLTPVDEMNLHTPLEKPLLIEKNSISINPDFTSI
ncbi:radical SAM protein [Halobacteriovorax sp. ZH5_bin.2]|uniref:SPL family radical SAM protein n=1 Tax=Halobacteriovorax sp. ZH5_bin.2 TaxID=3157727 RepID=UPI003710C589